METSLITFPEPVVFMSVVVSTSGRINEEFLRLLFLHVHCDVRSLDGELTEESVQFRFIQLFVWSISRITLG